MHSFVHSSGLHSPGTENKVTLDYSYCVCCKAERTLYD